MNRTYLLQLGSLILGFLSLGLPLVSMSKYYNFKSQSKGLRIFLSLGSAIGSLGLELVYLNYLFKIGDIIALIDIGPSLIYISLGLGFLSIFFNLIFIWKTRQDN